MSSKSLRALITGQTPAGTREKARLMRRSGRIPAEPYPPPRRLQIMRTCKPNPNTDSFCTYYGLESPVVRRNEAEALSSLLDQGVMRPPSIAAAVPITGINRRLKCCSLHIGTKSGRTIIELLLLRGRSSSAVWPALPRFAQVQAEGCSTG
jgi:hypothetical protein